MSMQGPVNPFAAHSQEPFVPVEIGQQQPENGSQEVSPDTASSIVSLSCNVVLNQPYSSSKSGIPLGAIITPLPDMRRAPLVVRHAPVACSGCCAVISKYCKVDLKTGKWTCVFCQQSNSSQALIAESYQPGGMLKSEAVDFVLTSPPESSSPPPILVLLLDIACTSSILENMKNAIIQVIAKIPRRTQIMLITFGASVSVYRLGKADIASAECFPGREIAPPEILRVLTEAAFEGECDAPLHSCREMAEQAIQSLSSEGHEGKRCLGAAINTALHILREKLDRDHKSESSDLPERQSMDRQRPLTPSNRILVITTGPCSQGPGSVSSQEQNRNYDVEKDIKSAEEFTSQLVDSAQGPGTVIDMIAVGMHPKETPLLSHLASETGGILLLRKGFGPLFASNCVAMLSRRVGWNGIMDYHVSENLKPIQIIGSVNALDRGPHSLVAKSGSGFLHGTDAVELGMIERGQAVGICFDVQKVTTNNYAYFQAIISWTAEDGSSVHRCVTRQMLVSNNTNAVLQNLDCEIAGLLLAKKVIQRAKFAESALSKKTSERLRRDIGKHLEHVASKVGHQVEYAAGWFTKLKRWTLPQSLGVFSEVLYQLQRSAMIGGQSCDPEEQILLQNLFLQAAPSVSLRMLAPELHLLERGSGQFNIVLPADIALWSDSAAILDHGIQIFIWLGKASPAGMPDPSGNGLWTRTSLVCERQASRIAAERFPIPEVLIVNEGSPEAKQVVQRLIPLQNDTLEEQQEQLPVLAFLTEDQLNSTLARQEHTEELSLVQWTRSVGVQPPPPPDNHAEIVQGMAAARATSIGIASLGSTQSLAGRRQHSQKLTNKALKAES